MIACHMYIIPVEIVYKFQLVIYIASFPGFLTELAYTHESLGMRLVSYRYSHTHM